MILTQKYLIFDRDRIFSPQVKQLIKNIDIKPKLISYQAPWQNSIAERWILSAKDDMLNHIIVLSEEHLKRLLREYFKYYNNDRCHLTLNRNTPIVCWNRDISSQMEFWQTTTESKDNIQC